MNREILHLDMDAFFASIEQAANPKLKDKPVIVGSRDNKYRTVVAACSYQTRACGVKSGMSAALAFRLCPEAVFMAADCSKYIYTAQEIHRLLQGFSPRVEMASIDEFNLDITGCQRLFGSTGLIARLIKEKIRKQLGISGSIGIAPNKLMAKLASKMRKPDGLVIWKREELPAILKDLPVEKICGIGPKITSYLYQLSIFTCGQLAQTAQSVLVRQFGKYGLWLKQAARGEDSSQVGLCSEPELRPKSVGHSYTLEQDISNTDLICAWIRLLCEMVAARLRQQCLAGSVVHIYLRSPELKWWSRQRKFPQASFDGHSLYQRSLFILKDLLPQPQPVRALGVSVSGLEPAATTYFFWEDKRRQRLLCTLDQINQRFGERAIYPAQLALVN